MQNPAAAMPAGQKLLVALGRPQTADARPAIRQVLQAAAGADPSQRAQAMKLHEELEEMNGYTQLLLEAYCDPMGDPIGQQLAILSCKHVVTRNWSRRVGSKMSDEEKQSIKAFLLQLIARPYEVPFWEHLVMVLRRIGRWELPANWNELGQHLLRELGYMQGAALEDYRALTSIKVLHHVLKEQACKKMRRDVVAFYEFGKAFLQPVGRVWIRFTEMLKSNHRSLMRGPDGERIWEQSRYLDGCLMLLLCKGHQALDKVPDGPMLVASMKEKFVFLLELGKTDTLTKSEFFRKNLKSVSKWMAMLIAAQPAAFAVANLGSVLETSVKVIEVFGAPLKQQAANDLTPFCEALVQNSVESLKNALDSEDLLSTSSSQCGGPMQECHQHLVHFLERAGIGNLADFVCSHTLEWPAQELQEWLADPEDQLAGPGSAAELRQVATKFFQAVCKEPLQKHFLQHLVERVRQQKSILPRAQDPYLHATPPAIPIATRDATLSLLIICHETLRNQLTFGELLEILMPNANLVAEGLSQNTPAVLLPVRMCQVIRTWHASMGNPAVDPMLQMLESFLDPRCPKALRLAAMGPLADVAKKFEDHMAWDARTLSRSILNLLPHIQTPQFLWKSLNLAYTLLRVCPLEQVTNADVECFGACWRLSLSGAEYVGGALLDLLVELLASVRPLSPLFLRCCGEIAQSCCAHYQAPEVSTSGNETSAALFHDLDGAAEAGGQEAFTATPMLKKGQTLAAAVQRLATS